MTKPESTKKKSTARCSGESLINSIRAPFRRGEAALIVPDAPHQWIFDAEDVDENGNIENITITFSTEMLQSLAQAIPEYEPMMAWYELLGTSLKFSKKESETIGQILLQMETSTSSQSSSPCSPYHRIPHFNRTFKRWVGMTPNEYRAQKIIGK